MYIIKLQNCAFFAYHGALTAETELGQRFFVDAELSVDAPDALEHDDVAKTVDYGEVFKLMERIVTAERFDLIEALAARIGMQMKEAFPAVRRAAITVRKPSVPIAGILDGVSATVVTP